MRTEKMKPEDQTALADIHQRMGIQYQLPDFSGPMFVVGKVVKDDQGNIRGGLAVKIIGEAFLLLDPAMSRYEKAKAVSLLSLSGTAAAKDASLEDVTAWIPPAVEQTFAPLLHDLGWLQSPWRSWSKPIR